MAFNMSRRGFIATAGSAFTTALLAGCGANSQSSSSQSSSSQSETPTTPATEATPAKTAVLDYQILINKQHKLPDNWEDAIELEHFTNSENWEVDVEKKSYAAYLELKKELEAEGVYVDLDSAFRSAKEQQRIWDDFTKEKGEAYTRTHVAVPGYSEHQTGLALDLFLIIDGKGVYENDEMMTHPDIWEKIHAKLADHGFILRYLPQRKLFTGYSYEPWHIRYLDDVDLARKITEAGVTYEEYLDEVDPMVAGCEIDYGKSTLYTDADIDSAIAEMMDQFSTWKGCTLKRFAFGGDEACGASELEYVNSLREEGTEAFDQAIVLVTDFHSPSGKDAEGTAWEPDSDYKDYRWSLGRTGASGSWKLMTWGYA